MAWTQVLGMSPNIQEYLRWHERWSERMQRANTERARLDAERKQRQADALGGLGRSAVIGAYEGWQQKQFQIQQKQFQIQQERQRAEQEYQQMVQGLMQSYIPTESMSEFSQGQKDLQQLQEAFQRGEINRQQLAEQRYTIHKKLTSLQSYRPRTPDDRTFDEKLSANRRFLMGPDGKWTGLVEYEQPDGKIMVKSALRKQTEAKPAKTVDDKREQFADLIDKFLDSDVMETGPDGQVVYRKMRPQEAVDAALNTIKLQNKGLESLGYVPPSPLQPPATAQGAMGPPTPQRPLTRAGRWKTKGVKPAPRAPRPTKEEIPLGVVTPKVYDDLFDKAVSMVDMTEKGAEKEVRRIFQEMLNAWLSQQEITRAPQQPGPYRSGYVAQPEVPVGPPTPETALRQRRPRAPRGERMPQLTAQRQTELAQAEARRRKDEEKERIREIRFAPPSHKLSVAVSPHKIPQRINPEALKAIEESGGPAPVVSYKKGMKLRHGQIYEVRGSLYVWDEKKGKVISLGA